MTAEVDGGCTPECPEICHVREKALVVSIGVTRPLPSRSGSLRAALTNPPGRAGPTTGLASGSPML